MHFFLCPFFFSPFLRVNCATVFCCPVFYFYFNADVNWLLGSTSQEVTALRFYFPFFCNSFSGQQDWAEYIVVVVVSQKIPFPSSYPYLLRTRLPGAVHSCRLLIKHKTLPPQVMEKRAPPQHPYTFALRPWAVPNFSLQSYCTQSLSTRETRA